MPNNPSSARRTPTKTAPPRPPSKTVATQEDAKRRTLTSFVQTYTGDFARVAPAHISPEAFVELAVGYVRRDPKLREAADANPASLIMALRQCAALGHTPVPKIYALVPFGNHKAPGGKEVVGIETYHGVIERMYRAGGVQSVHCELVRRGDRFRWDALNQRVTVHEYDPFASEADRGELMGVYAWARLFTGGTSQVVWLNREQVMKHRAVSRSGDAFWGGPWEADMWRKTALHGLERYVPTSAEYRWQVALSGSAAGAGFAGIPDAPVLEYGPSPDDGPIDAEVVDEPARPALREQRQPPAEPDRARGDQPDRATPQEPTQQAEPVDETDGADPDNDPHLPDPNPFDQTRSPEEWAAWERQESGGGS